MPLVWIGLGIIAIIIFVAVMAIYQGVPFLAPSGPAPTPIPKP
jgi:hypothetical protein